MIRPIAALSLIALLAGCGGIRDSRINPFNWFGRSAPAERVETQVPGQPQAPVDQRPLAQHIVDARMEQVPSGAILRATGVPPSQGWWDADLVAQPVSEDGTLVVEFRLKAPLTQTATGPQRSREVVAALHLSHSKLANVRRVVVQGANDARALGR